MMIGGYVPMDRLTFLDSIKGIDYPNMLVEFFDQFIALKKIVEGYGSVSVESSNDRCISFITSFKNQKYKDKAISNMAGCDSMVIYGKPIYIMMENLSDTELRFTLQ